MTARDFSPDDFARFHPGGRLGRKLLVRVKDLMRTDNLPFLDAGCQFYTADHPNVGREAGDGGVRHSR
jgi:hypothetical protein